MQKKSVKKLRIDLSDKSPDEIADFLSSLPDIRRILVKKGYKLKIDRKYKPVLVLPKTV